MTAPAIPAGRRVVDRLPLLAGQAGSPPDLVLRWNAMPARPATLDLVLHLHGYSMSGAAMNIATSKLPISGLDFEDPDRPQGETAGRSRPTLALLPRGRYFGGRTGRGYDFPVLTQPPGTRRLVRLARALFREATGCGPIRSGRRVLTAHSGGGVAVMPVARQFDPHEILIFDGLYAAAPALAEWAAARIARDAAALPAARDAPAYMARRGGALRVFYVPGTGTEEASRALAAAVADALAKAGPAGAVLASRYRVEPVALDHLLMPRRLGWRLLADAAAD